MNLFTLLNANNYFSVNREVARKIGLHATIMLTEIIDKFTYFESRGLLDDGWFYLTVEEVEDRTTLAKDAQSGAIKVLKDLGLIETRQRGMPAKRNFKVFKEKFAEWCNSSNKKEETRQQGVDNSENKVEDLPPTAPIYKSPREETKVVCTSPVVPEKSNGILNHVSKKHPEGHEISISLEEVFRQAVLQKKSWDTQEIAEAWKILSDYRGLVRDFIAFIDGTIKNIRNEKKGKEYSIHKKREEEQCQKAEKNILEPCKKTSSERVTVGQIFPECLEEERRLKNSTTGYNGRPIPVL